MYFRWAALMAPDPFWREARAEFAGGESIQGAEAGGKLDLGQVAPEASCSFRSSPRSRNVIRHAPAPTTALQKHAKCALRRRTVHLPTIFSAELAARLLPLHAAP